nr:hypothetical protein CFP56_51094 [Quercus suber]
MKPATMGSGVEAGQAEDSQANMETEERDEINEIDGAVTTEIEEGNTLQTVKNIEVDNTSSLVFEVESNSPVVTQLAPDLIGSHNGREINEEGLIPYTAIIPENLFDIQINQIDADLGRFDNNQNSRGETAKVFNANNNSEAIQFPLASKRATCKSCAALMKNLNTVNPQPRKKKRPALIPRSHLEPGKKELAKTIQQTVRGGSRPMKKEEVLTI